MTGEFLLLAGNPSRKRQVRLFIKDYFKLTVNTVVFGGSALFKGKHSHQGFPEVFGLFAITKWSRRLIEDYNGVIDDDLAAIVRTKGSAAELQGCYICYGVWTEIFENR